MRRSRAGRLAEHCTIAAERPSARPVVDHPHKLETAGSQFSNQELRCDAVATPILRDAFRRPRPERERRKVDDRKHTTGTRGAQEACIGLRRIGQVMVNPAQENGVATVGGQARVAGLGLNDGHIVEQRFAWR